MLELLIAILISLGISVQPSTTEAELKAEQGANYNKATEIMNSGNYRTTDGGGVVVIEVGGD